MAKKARAKLRYPFDKHHPAPSSAALGPGVVWHVRKVSVNSKHSRLQPMLIISNMLKVIAATL